MPVWMIVVEWSARLILLCLILLSIWSIAIIIDRKNYFKLLNIQDYIESLKELAHNYKSEKVSLALSKEYFNQKTKMDKGLSVLGTLGSTTPFIGLLGTILGIIVAFGELSQGSGDTNSVMFALAEALILTAVGLFVAIPAVIAFNIYSKKTKRFFDEVSTEIDLYLANKKD